MLGYTLGFVSKIRSSETYMYHCSSLFVTFLTLYTLLSSLLRVILDINTEYAIRPERDRSDQYGVEEDLAGGTLGYGMVLYKLLKIDL